MTWLEFVALVAVGCTTVVLGLWFFQFVGVRKATAATLAAGAVGVEELFASARNAQVGVLEAPSIVSVGSQLHTIVVFGFPLIILMTLAAFPVFATPRLHTDFPVRYVTGIAGLLGAVALSGALHGGMASAAKAVAAGAVLILGGMLIGRHLRDFDQRKIALALLGVMAVKAIVGALVTVGFGARGPRFVLYYDSLTPALAAAILLAVFVRQNWDRLHVWLALTAGVVLLLSPRRTPLLALLAAGLLVVVTTSRGRVLKRALTVGGLVAASLAFSSFLPESLRRRAESGIAVLTGAEQEDSASGHFSDLERGLVLGTDGPFFGLGPGASQPSGLAADKAKLLYIHNEFLHVWVGFGVLAALFICVLILIAAVDAARFTRRASTGEASLVETVAMCFLLQIPVVLMFFPYLSTTSRWPLLYGICVAVAAGALMRNRHGSTVAPSDREGDGEAQERVPVAAGEVGAT